MLPSEESVVSSALERNDRYLLEFIEALHICPYARTCRETGQLRRIVRLDQAMDAASVAAQIKALESEAEIEIGLLLFPQLQIDAPGFERYIRDVRAAYERGRTGPTQFFVVAFHPELPMRVDNPDVAVRFLRRSPDPTIQLVRSSAIDRVRKASRDPHGLSGFIAEAGLRAILAAGPERVASLLHSMRPAATEAAAVATTATSSSPTPATTGTSPAPSGRPSP